MEKNKILETLFTAKEGCQKYDDLLMQLNQEEKKIYSQQVKIHSIKSAKTILISTIIGLLIDLGINHGQGGMIGLALGLVVGIVYVIFRKVSLKKEFNEVSARSNKNIMNIQEQMNGVANTYREVLSIVPEDYWFTQAIEQLIKYFQADRANDIKEALHLLDEQIHRWKLENQNNEMLLAQQRHEEYLRSIDANSKSASMGAWASAAASIYNRD